MYVLRYDVITALEVIHTHHSIDGTLLVDHIGIFQLRTNQRIVVVIGSVDLTRQGGFETSLTSVGFQVCCYSSE